MTSVISGDLYKSGLSSEMLEEHIIEKILSKLQNERQLNSIELIEDLKKDLLDLKMKFGESEFKARYLNTREKALQQFIDNFPSMLGYWNKELINVHSNKAYATYFGKSPSEIRNRNISDLLGEKIFSLNLKYINGVLNGNPQTFERDIPTPDGQIKSTLANYIPHFLDDEVIGFFVIVTDITEKKQLEEKTKTLEASLYEQSRLSSIGQMASGIAHEINNPVSIIYGDAYLVLKEFKKESPDRDFIIARLSEIESTALRIEKIVDGLQSLHAGRSGVLMCPNVLAQVVDRVLAICSNRFLRAGIKIIWHLPEKEIGALCSDIQVSEIILNILNNAFDEVKKVKNGEVEIRILESTEHCEIRISNNGPIIKKNERDHLFLPFYTTKGKNGTGLGLKISRDLARANGGELWLSENEKTEFILSLPALK
tara:strand:+ start:16819 stop:18099 length:1281 start_codon:yes stop_codon:yes gene_type:complete